MTSTEDQIELGMITPEANFLAKFQAIEGDQ